MTNRMPNGGVGGVVGRRADGMLKLEVESISDQGRAWLAAHGITGGYFYAPPAWLKQFGDAAPVGAAPVGAVAGAPEALLDRLGGFFGDAIASVRDFVSGLLEAGSDEMAIDGDGETGDEEESIESMAAMFGVPLDRLALAVLGTTALVPLAPKALTAAGGTALVAGGKALTVPAIRAIAARTVALAPATVFRVAAGKSVIGRVLAVLMGLLTAKEIYDILSDLFPSIFPPLWDERGPAVAVYERGNLVAFTRGPVTHAPGSRHPGGRYVRKLHRTGPRVSIIL